MAESPPSPPLIGNINYYNLLNFQPFFGKNNIEMEALKKEIGDKAARKIQHWFRAMKEAKSPVSTESSEPTTPQYSFRKQLRDESGKLVEEVINYGEIMNSTIVEIFGHLMLYDDLKKYARFPHETTYLTAEFNYREEHKCYFAVFTDTDSTDSYHTNGLYHGEFHRGGMSMEPFITLGQIESELENAEDEEREAESSEAASPTSPEAASPSSPEAALPTPPAVDI
jgi:hypothetical protein